jgi:hypothetical protein
MSSPDQSETEGSDEAVSAGELGQAVNANSPAGHMGQADVVIGEIPDADDPTQLVTPARRGLVSCDWRRYPCIGLKYQSEKRP